MKIHHVGIAVKSLDEASGRFGDLLGLEKAERYDLPEFGVSALFMPVGDSNLEFLEPLGDASTAGKFIEKRGEGVHHICFEVDDLERTLESLADSGVELVDHAPRKGLSGMIAFVHPKSTGGVLVELVDRASAVR